MHREQTSAEVGQARIEPSAPVVAGSGGTWRITYTAGSGGIAPGGRVRITIPHGFTTPQTSAFFDPGFTTVETDASGVELSLSVASMVFCRLDPATGHSGAWGRSVFVEVAGRGLTEGESFTLTYGNADYYRSEPFALPGAYARELSGPAEFTVAVDPDGKRAAPYSGYVRLAEQPTLQVLPGPPVRLRALLPSDALAGEEVQATVVACDRFNNPVSVERQGVALSEGGPARVTVRARGLEARSNPVRLHTHKPAVRVYWGDIHGHTRHSDGLGTPAEYYAYAREVGALDFAAITDHDDIGPRLADEEWEVIQQATDEANDPGRFVTLLGFEYRNGLCDMCVYYPGARGELLRGTDGKLADARELTRRVKQQGGMVVPHFHFGADWSGFDPEVYRLLEVYSQHGSAEHRGSPREIPYLRRQVQKSSASNKDCYAQDALSLGHRLGFTAGSDTHSARPGWSDWTRVCRTYLGGLTAVFAPELTRLALWDALYHRRCYATTGNRSLLTFAVSGAPMGSEVQVEPGAPRAVAVTCEADGELERLTIFRSGERWLEERLSGEHLERSYEDRGRVGPDWYYVRLDLAGGEMLWSSPVWVATEPSRTANGAR